MRSALPRLLVAWLALAIAMLTQPTSAPRQGEHGAMAQPERADIAANSSRRADFTAAADRRVVSPDDHDLFASLSATRVIATCDVRPIPECAVASFAGPSARSAAASQRGPPIAG